MVILLIEDDTNISTIAKITLEKIGHHKVDLAIHGKQGLELIEKTNYDLILVDGMMPIMDGHTFIKKCNEQNLQIPIIFLSAKSQESDIQEVMKLGALGYIQKPFDPMELNKKIQDILDGSRSP